MPSQNARPKWWQLYLIFPLLIVLFMLEHQLKTSTRGHQVVQIGIVLLIYGLTHLWLKANSSALTRMDREHSYGRVRVIRVPVSERPGSGNENSMRFKLPDSEINGVLSNTFEMDCIDAVAYPVDEISQESKKE
jgi:hypothetical protein